MHYERGNPKLAWTKQWTYGETIFPWCNHFHTSVVCYKPLLLEDTKICVRQCCYVCEIYKSHFGVPQFHIAPAVDKACIWIGILNRKLRVSRQEMRPTFEATVKKMTTNWHLIDQLVVIFSTVTLNIIVVELDRMPTASLWNLTLSPSSYSKCMH